MGSGSIRTSPLRTGGSSIADALCRCRSNSELGRDPLGVELPSFCCCDLLFWWWPSSSILPFSSAYTSSFSVNTFASSDRSSNASVQLFDLAAGNGISSSSTCCCCIGDPATVDIGLRANRSGPNNADDPFSALRPRDSAAGAETCFAWASLESDPATSVVGELGRTLPGSGLCEGERRTPGESGTFQMTASSGTSSSESWYSSSSSWTDFRLGGCGCQEPRRRGRTDPAGWCGWWWAEEEEEGASERKWGDVERE